MRYLPHNEADRAEMLARIGVAGIDDLFAEVPKAARLDGPLADLPPHRGEMEVERELAALARRNVDAHTAPFFCGAGVYRHHVPATVDHLIQRGEFLTAYTPYQPEVAQGTLQYLFEFQTQVALLFGMEIANASLYDGSTATAEAVMMANRVTRRERAVLAGNLHPHYRAVVETLAAQTGFSLAGHEPDPSGADPAGLADLADLIDESTSCLVVQSPDVFGHPHRLDDLARAAHDKGALLICVVTEPVSLGLMAPPGAMGADIVVGEGQALGVGLQFGGPHLGLFATRRKFLRQMPGRLAGETVDAAGRRGYVLTLSTREQHIRREKATSNICTNSGLCALAFTIHLALLGEAGLARLARLNHARAQQLADRLAAVPGVEIVNDAFFNEITLRLPLPAVTVVEKLARDGVLGGVPAARLWPGRADFERLMLVAATETASEADIDALAAALEATLEREGALS